MPPIPRSPFLSPLLAGLALALSAAALPAVRGASLAEYLAAAPFKMDPVPEPVFPARTFPITDYGAVGDGHTLATAAIARAIDACASAGGGHVIIPYGIWLTGPILLKSNVDLHAEQGALVQFTPDHTAYPMVKREDRGYVACPAILANGQSNFALTGEGIYDGAGDTWRPVKRVKTTDDEWQGLVDKGGVTSGGDSIWWPSREAMAGEDYLADLAKRTKHPTPEETLPARDYLRSAMVSFNGCTKVLVEGVTLRNSASGVFVPNHCTNLTLRGVTIFNEWTAQNGDGMDIGTSRNVVIYRCTVSAGDDGICMKSGGRNPTPGQAALQNVIVAECTVYHGHGGFVVGGATDAGMHNLWATHCVFVGTDTGIRVKSGIGHGGLVDNVFVDHILMKDIVNEAIVFNTFYDNDPASAATVKKVIVRDAAKTPEFRGFLIRDILCTGARTAIALTGLPQMPIHQVVIEDSILTARHGFTAVDAADITLRHVRIDTPDTPVITQKNTRNIQFLD